MHRVVAGPTTTMLTRLVRKIVEMGAITPMKLLELKKPGSPELIIRVPGYVIANTTGSAVCIAK